MGPRRCRSTPATSVAASGVRRCRSTGRTSPARRAYARGSPRERPSQSASAPVGTSPHPCNSIRPRRRGWMARTRCGSAFPTSPPRRTRLIPLATSALISVDNSCPDSQGASVQADSISAGLEDPKTGQLRRTRAVRSSEGTALRGAAHRLNGPVKAASVCVYETVDEPAGIEQLVQVAKSNSAGRLRSRASRWAEPNVPRRLPLQQSADPVGQHVPGVLGTADAGAHQVESFEWALRSASAAESPARTPTGGE